MVVVDTKLYDALEVPVDATEDLVKQSYWRLSKLYHPDKNADGGEKFKEISLAYQILSDAQKRDLYDRYGMPNGEDFLTHMFRDAYDRATTTTTTHQQQQQEEEEEKKKTKRRGRDLVVRLKVTLKNLYDGNIFVFKIERTVICSLCRDMGPESRDVACTSCLGNGVHVVMHPVSPLSKCRIETRCSECNGSGRIVRPAGDCCTCCRGKKVLQEIKSVRVHVERGMCHGQRIFVEGEGHQEEENQTPGCLIVVLRQRRDRRFQRNGADLTTTCTISLSEALCGFRVYVRHLDGKYLLVEHDPGKVLTPGLVKRVTGEGMPVYGGNPSGGGDRGHLYIRFQIEFPTDYFADAEQMKKLKSLLPPPSSRKQKQRWPARLVKLVDCEDKNDDEEEKYDSSSSSSSSDNDCSCFEEDDD